ncbi:MAG: hypothetical protein KKD00_07590 [Gammaproteobacteria bacterium]|nr:hypothetical protein [Gammaproteobacteria bacterium]
MSLIEVLTASAVLATGILCLLVLQSSALGITRLAEHRQQASALLLELAELSYISPGTFAAIDPVMLMEHENTQLLCPSGTNCSPDMFVASELGNWVLRVKQGLPEAKIDIQRTLDAGQINWLVTLRWHGPRHQSQSSMQARLQL